MTQFSFNDYPINGFACDYVADDLAITPGPHCITDLDVAVGLIQEFLNRRITKAVDAHPHGRPVLLLSSGVDSILLAAAAKSLGLSPLCVTFDVPVQGEDGPETGFEARRAREVAEYLGFEHHVVAPSMNELVSSAREAVQRLEVTDLWEVVAGTVAVECIRRADQGNATGAVLTGAGADALFLGGDSTVTPGTWAQTMAANVSRNFRRERLVPDFYERLIEEPDRYIQVWQSTAAYELARKLSPYVVRGVDFGVDKYVLRIAAERFGMPAEFVTATKNPMQFSSGAVNGLLEASRSWLADVPEHSTYTNPRTEPVENIAVRLFLELLRHNS